MYIVVCTDRRDKREPQCVGVPSSHKYKCTFVCNTIQTALPSGEHRGLGSDDIDCNQ
jgi:hypothetical protein